MDLQTIEDEDLTRAAAAVRQYLQGRVFDDPSLVDDLTQETLVKVLQVRHRLERAATIPYAVTIAKHLVVARARSRAVAVRHAHRLHADPVVAPPDELVLQREDQVALRAALRALSDDDRALLLAHVVDGTDTATLAADTGSTAGGVAAKLARARARARVDYVVAAHRATLPTANCRPVLLSLSAADQRRQQALGAADHLVGCGVCADLSVQIVERRRAIGALLPIPVLARGLGALRGVTHAHPIASVTSAMGAVGVATAVAIASHSAPPRRAALPPTTARPAASSPISAAPRRPAALEIRPLLGLSRQRMQPLVGRRVVAEHVLVLSVPADEGFWVGYDDDQRIWVQLSAHGESSVKVVAGRRVSFLGTLVGHDSDFAARAGADRADGGAQLTRMGAHISVPASKLAISQ